jgi:hypothetical protein
VEPSLTTMISEVYLSILLTTLATVVALLNVGMITQ